MAAALTVSSTVLTIQAAERPDPKGSPRRREPTTHTSSLYNGLCQLPLRKKVFKTLLGPSESVAILRDSPALWGGQPGSGDGSGDGSLALGRAVRVWGV